MNQFFERMPQVLLIDDDQTMHLWANRQLSGNFKLISAFNGRDGIDAFKEYFPDIVLVDIDMPEIDGLAVCHAIRNLPEGRNTPLLMVTGNEESEKINSSFVAGATDYVLKPVNWKVLIHRLGYLVKASNVLERLEKNEVRLSKVQKMARLGHWEWPVHEQLMNWSDEIYQIFELNRDSFIPTYQLFLDQINPIDRAYVEESFDKAIEEKSNLKIEFQILTGQGGNRFVGQQIEVVLNRQQQLVALIGTIQDITERKEYEFQVRQLAYYDAITGLPNRIYFLEMLSKTLELAKRKSRHFAVLFLDLDGFKVVNDLYGHHVGDLLLKEISRRLTDGLRNSDIATRNLEQREQGIGIARLGGDEIIILLNELTHPEDAAIAAKHIQELITEPLIIENQKIYPGVSIGIAVYPEDGSDSETLLKNADVAMYYAKKLGKGNYQFFHDSMNVKARKRQEMENHMKQALANNELRLHYQPVVNALSGELVGMEALMRWDSPQLGFLAPDMFIPIAEENGMILQFGEWALREICSRYKDLQEIEKGGLTIALNLSAVQLKQTGFVAMIKNLIKEFDVNPAFMIFEIAESVISSDAEKNLATLTELKNLGIQLTVDDFGAGFSSLNFIKSFPLDAIKIDRAYVKDLPNNPDHAAFVNAILTLANNLHLHSIAEGVETEKQKEFLQINDCESIQGFLLSQPMPFEDLKDFLRLYSTETDANPF